MEGVHSVNIIGDKIHLKKGKFSWRVVEPYKNSDGTINWFNLLTGGKSNLVRVGIYIGIALLIYLGLNETMTSCQMVADEYAKCCVQEITIPQLFP